MFFQEDLPHVMTYILQMIFHINTTLYFSYQSLLFLKAEIPLDLYKNIENNFAERLAAEEENQFMIDVKWANEFLKK